MRRIDNGSGAVIGSLDWFENLTGKARNIEEIQAKIVALQEELERAQVEIMTPEEKEKYMENKAKARVSDEMKEVKIQIKTEHFSCTIKKRIITI